MTLSRRETILFWSTAVVALIGTTYLISQPRIREWQRVSGQQAETLRKIQMAERLVAQGPQWTSKLGVLRQKLPQHPAEKDVTADLLVRLEQLTATHGLTLVSREVEKETQHGDLYELAVNCKWEGRLEAVTHFLFDLQKEDAIVDISQLSITPDEKKALKGSLTVYCSYARLPGGGGTRKPDTKAEVK